MAIAIDTSERLYRTSEAADFLGISLDTIRKHVQRGNLKFAEQVGMAYLFGEDELVRFLRDRRPRGNPSFFRRN